MTQQLSLTAPAAPVDWSDYAEAYDLLLDYNPAYRALLSRFETFLEGVDLDGAACLDAGAGTGNFASRLPLSRIERLALVDPNSGMMRRARAKLPSSVAEFHETGFETYRDEAGTFDLVICTNALFAMPDPPTRLAQMHELLRPEGRLFLVDLGRRVSVWDWSLYLGTHMILQAGPMEGLKVLRRSRPIRRQNGRIRQGQTEGTYWTHTLDELAQHVAAAGFEVTGRETVYRGYCDLVTGKNAP
ncbi:class I SAM-dependent methyltransferase [Limimaricola pyoseonensis]|uniref:Ubiquinone/menaquinone biosynthesis C-methylase UbiE n=1 Tax=Limimaricola pyoseonensis TaxID=521013 RepID=A0A1G7B3E4_9RHOB|nr:class I SAM-dependent methyltransferase [Limimaricola pyoseonensis]SDE21543.1 Ubiquinone/menaquinone biosynthesis C-methylase UbiE [Limimaricola pyoseonensis]